MPVLLVIDDEDAIRYSFRYIFEEDEVQVVTAATGAEGLHLLRRCEPDVVLLDLQLPDQSGLDVFHRIQADDPKRPVIFVTAHGTSDSAIEAMKHGAFDYLVKPVALDRLSQLLARAFDAARLMRVPPVLPVEDGADRIVGRSPPMQETCKAIGRIAPRDVNVLIRGESGTGKELVARAVYHHSKRADKPYLAINCAAITETLLESELFGHEQGAFTGAHRRHVGKFERCDGGTLFLDEIGDMAPALQAKMLRILQDQQFERVGGNETLQAHVRVIAATNCDLEKAVADGAFRKDLYFRLRGATIRVPALRERLGDVPELAHYFLFRSNRELQRDWRDFAPETLELFQQYDWPGNVRELQSVVKEAMLQGSGHTLLPEFLPPEFGCFRSAAASERAGSIRTGIDAAVETLLADGRGQVHSRAVEALERVLLPRALQQTQGHLTKASRILGLSRNTLRQKMRALGFAVNRVFTQENETETQCDGGGET